MVRRVGSGETAMHISSSCDASSAPGAGYMCDGSPAGAGFSCMEHLRVIQCLSQILLRRLGAADTCMPMPSLSALQQCPKHPSANQLAHREH